jgi:glutaconate CoA-transferase subunit A
VNAAAPASPESKLRTLEEAAELVPDGATIGIGGLSMNSAPMAFVRTLARRRVKDLTVVAVVAGMPIEWLVAAGCVRRVVSGLVSLEGFGLAPRFRAAVQAGQVEIEEYSEHTLICRLQAAAYHLPHMPTKAGLGTDMLELHPDTLRQERDPVTGEPYVACTPLPLDIGVVHATEADTRGNVRVDPKLIWMDAEVVRAAATTIVTVERIVPGSTFSAAPGRTTYPRFMVDAVAEAPWGAYPTSCFPRYLYDGDFCRSYVAAHASGETAQQFWSERIDGPETHAAFLDSNGGARTLLAIARKTA